MAIKTRKGFIVALIVLLSICGGGVIANSAHNLIGGKMEYTVIVGVFASLLVGFFIFLGFYKKLQGLEDQPLKDQPKQK